QRRGFGLVPALGDVCMQEGEGGFLVAMVFKNRVADPDRDWHDHDAVLADEGGRQVAGRIHDDSYAHGPSRGLQHVKRVNPIAEFRAARLAGSHGQRLRSKASGNIPMSASGPDRSMPGSSSTAIIRSWLSLPQNSPPSTCRVGTPKTPVSSAESVSSRRRCLTCGDSIAAMSWMPRPRAVAVSEAALPSRPSRQIELKIASIDPGVIPAATHNRSAGNGLNGCDGGNNSGTPSRRACHSAWR